MALREGYKQTEVGVIPEDWKVKAISDIANVKTGPFGSALHESDYVRDGTPIITVEHLSESGVVHKNLPLVSDLDRIRLKSYSLRENDIVFSRVGSVDRNSLVSKSEKGWLFSGRLLRVRVFDSSLHPSYLSHYFHSEPFKRRVREVAVGQTMASINTQILKGVSVVLPTPDEQRAIAAALSDMDALLEGLDRLIAKKRNLKQATMQQLLTGKTRLPGFCAGSHLSSDAMDGKEPIEGEWEVKRLGQVAKIQRGASPRPIDSPVWFDQNSSIGWVRISDVTRSGMFLKETSQRLSPLGVQHSRPVPSGSLIMSICATVGRPVITTIDVCIHDGFVVFDNLEADQLFIYYILKWIEPDWSKHGQTGSQMNLNTGLINSTEIKLPPREEQTAIATILSDMDAEIEALQQRRAKTRDLKQAMMQELLTGKTRLISSKEC